MALNIVRTRADLRESVQDWRRGGSRVAVVPTMGALHEGHAGLIRIAREQADRTIATIFVNPRQFDADSDLAAYPRDEARDVAMLESLGVDLLYAPGVEEIYPDGFDTTVSLGRASRGLCGEYRPGHFDGVATVCAKLFLQTAADIALFGEKDFQQLLLIRRLVRDLDVPIEIVAGATVREADGLALSSRNARLTQEQRRAAPSLAAALFAAAGKLSSGGRPDRLIAEAEAAILDGGFDRVEYLELRAELDLAPLTAADRPGRLLAAAWLGDVRLIDNVPVTPAGR